MAWPQNGCGHFRGSKNSIVPKILRDLFGKNQGLSFDANFSLAFWTLGEITIRQ